MPAFAPGSQRRAAAPACLVAAVALLAGCSLLAPPTPSAGPSVAPGAQWTPVATPAIAPTAAPPTPAATPDASPPAAAELWRSVVRPLAPPGAWLDFGFAANGDVLAIGTEDAAATPLRLFVARYAPGGRKRWEHHLNRSMTPLAGDWASFDTTDDSIVVVDYDSPAGLFSLRRFSSANGANLTNVRTDSGINRLAIDGRGRQYGLPQYGVDGNVYAAVVRLDMRSRLKLGVDYWLRPLTAGERPDEPGILAVPVAIGFGLDGRVVVVDEPDIAATFQDGTSRRRAVVTSLTADLSSPRQWELPVDWEYGSEGFGTWSHRLAIAGASDGSVYLGEPVLDDAGTAVVGWRVRLFDSKGEQLRAWGAGVPGSAATAPHHPAVDRAGRLWVIDVDPATGRSIIAVLEAT